jgi:hypothetical protein
MSCRFSSASDERAVPFFYSFKNMPCSSDTLASRNESKTHESVLDIFHRVAEHVLSCVESRLGCGLIA